MTIADPFESVWAIWVMERSTLCGPIFQVITSLLCLAHEVARVAMSTDGLSGILHAHVALGLYMLGIATQTHIEQRAADDRAVVVLLRSLSNVFKLSVLHQQRQCELAQLRVEGKACSRVQHVSAPQACTEVAGVYTWTVEHVSYVRTTQNVSKALLLLADVRLLCLARAIAEFHGELALLRSLSNVFKLSVLHQQRQRELAQLRVEGKA